MKNLKNEIIQNQEKRISELKDFEKLNSIKKIHQ